MISQQYITHDNTVNNWHYSPLQHPTYDHPHHHLISRELGESVLFQLVLKAYPTCHSWIITAHVSLGHLKRYWKAFNRQLIRTHQLLQFLSHQPSAPTKLILLCTAVLGVNKS